MNKTLLKILIWTISILLSAIFIMASIGKFSLKGNMHENFTSWGYGAFLLILVGTVELIGGISLLIPRVRKIGIGLLIIVMLGATYTHFVNFSSLGIPAFPLILIVVLAALFILERIDIHG